MTSRKRGRGAEQGPAPLTPEENDEARPAIRDELEKLRKEAAEELARAQRNLAVISDGITAFEREQTLSEHLGWQAYIGVQGAELDLGTDAAFGDGDSAPYWRARRLHRLVGLYLREQGHPYLSEYKG
ncbi:hypothetical protein [Nonomuraea sp. NEAU-A123]|uniref:hypothetical protein n=1 Tax=Nonomuraea sp. NEAU-A123 TaxID=2839649 RepID=UPI001BE42747|nr:hypothetical protein [Nonomuraea sp. NEAU-A123]MBT2226254.1 hypothetical protein [Nonomuraea sp. NEAU-A123]